MSKPKKIKEEWTRRTIGIEESSLGRWRIIAKGTSHKTGKKAKKEKILSQGHTLDDAKVMWDHLKSQIRGEQALAQQRVTLGSYLLNWLARHKKKFSPATYATYVNYLRYLILFAGDIYCDAFTRRDMEDFSFYLSNLKQKRNPNKYMAQATLNSIWRHVVNAIKDMAADYHLPDPTLRVDKPIARTSKIREDRTYTAKQVLDFVEAGWEVNSYERALMNEIVAFVGMRPGEVAALKPEHLDTEFVDICSAVSLGVWRDRTKSKSDRRGYMPPPTMKKCRAWLRESIATQRKGIETGLMFTNRYGRPHKGDYLRGAMERAGEKAKLPFRPTPQILRRTWNVLYLKARVDRIVLRSQIGHTDEEMTELYTGVKAFDEEKKEAHGQVFHLFGCPPGGDTEFQEAK